MDMLWYLCLWHSLVKLRLQSETTVLMLECVTTDVGAAVRRFCRISEAAIKTYELPADEAARGKRDAAKRASRAAQEDDSSASAGMKRKRTAAEDDEPAPKRKPRKPVVLSLKTFKFHNMGHYAAEIPRTGPTDNGSTQTVSPNVHDHHSHTNHLFSGRGRAQTCQSALWTHQQAKPRGTDRDEGST